MDPAHIVKNSLRVQQSIVDGSILVHRDHENDHGGERRGSEREHSPRHGLGPNSPPCRSAGQPRLHGGCSWGSLHAHAAPHDDLSLCEKQSKLLMIASNCFKEGASGELAVQEDCPGATRSRASDQGGALDAGCSSSGRRQRAALAARLIDPPCERVQTWCRQVLAAGERGHRSLACSASRWLEDRAREAQPWHGPALTASSSQPEASRCRRAGVFLRAWGCEQRRGSGVRDATISCAMMHMQGVLL